MDFQTAERFVINQGIESPEHADTILARLKQGHPPIPGHVTSLLLALKVLAQELQGAEKIDRVLASALFNLAYSTRQAFETGQRSGVEWPPLLDDDLNRIAIAVHSIFNHS